MSSPSDSEPSTLQNQATFLDCLSTALLTSLAPSQPQKAARRHRRRQNSRLTTSTTTTTTTTNNNNTEPALSPADIADFSSHLSEEIFPFLPLELRTLSYSSLQENPSLGETYSTPLSLSILDSLSLKISPSVIETLTSHGVLPDLDSLPSFLSSILNPYINSSTLPPPTTTQRLQRTSACELCARNWVPLTYHHLIPRSVAAKAVKRGWHADWQLADVAWLCRACHNFVHQIGTNEELAREWYSIQKIEEREDVQKWVAWIGGVRWKKR